jgi:hypothetical protein
MHPNPAAHHLHLHVTIYVGESYICRHYPYSELEDGSSMRIINVSTLLPRILFVFFTMVYFKVDSKDFTSVSANVTPQNGASGQKS